MLDLILSSLAVVTYICVNYYLWRWSDKPVEMDILQAVFIATVGMLIDIMIGGIIGFLFILAVLHV